jgi:hypothetical protein
MNRRFMVFEPQPLVRDGDFSGLETEIGTVAASRVINCSGMD